MEVSIARFASRKNTGRVARLPSLNVPPFAHAQPDEARATVAKFLCDAIPHDDLCIQWDFCHEMIALDGQPQDWFPREGASQAEIMARPYQSHIRDAKFGEVCRQFALQDGDE